MKPDSGVGELVLVLAERLGWFILELIITWAILIVCVQQIGEYLEKTSQFDCGTDFRSDHCYFVGIEEKPQPGRTEIAGYPAAEVTSGHRTVI